MKRRNFVRASVIGAGALAFTPATSLFAQKTTADDFVTNLDLATLDPKLTKHYVQFSEEFFDGLPDKARRQSTFQNVVLPSKTVSYTCDSKGYNLTFLNRNGEKVSFISKKGKSYTVIMNS